MDQANTNALIRGNRDLTRQAALDNDLSELTSGNRIRNPKEQTKLLIDFHLELGHQLPLSTRMPHIFIHTGHPVHLAETCLRGEIRIIVFRGSSLSVLISL